MTVDVTTVKPGRSLNKTMDGIPKDIREQFEKAALERAEARLMGKAKQSCSFDVLLDSLAADCHDADESRLRVAPIVPR
jgi:hypothetical protein